MTHIKISNGLDIPIQGKPVGKVAPLHLSEENHHLISLDLKPYEDVKFKLLVQVDDVVKIGQPLAEDKSSPGRMFVSPAAGTIKDIRRGLKRVLQDIVIEVAKQEDYQTFEALAPSHATREQLIERLKAGGMFARIRNRPFNLLANPEKAPRAIFVKAIESAPFVPSAEMQVEGHEKDFHTGLNALSKLTDGAVHLVYHKDSPSKAFTEAPHVQKHTAEGPHPIANSSLHIQKIDPIRNWDDTIWTLNAHDVVAIGYLLNTGRYFIDRIISIAGPGVIEGRTGYFKVREGFPVESLIAGRLPKGSMRLISGDPLMGKKVESQDFIGVQHFAFTIVPENTHREFMHFFRLGTDKYSFSKAYVTGHLDNSDRQYPFTTNQHGEHRAFIDSTLYDQVQPLKVPTMLLVKAVMAEDYDLAQSLGLLEVDSEDFALPTFVCPSKMEMTDIIKGGIKQYAKEMLA